jgi:N-acetylglucosaminyl-diphospho-decaprenol L-rhamnosyltransferase
VATVDVVVVCWNNADRILKALDSVFALSEVRADPGFANVVVSDNGSTDGSREAIRARFGERVQIIENGGNLGFGAACNRALERTRAPYAYLLNSDATLKDGALANVVAFLDAHPLCGIAGSRIYAPDGTIAESCGEFDTWTGAFLRSSAWGEWPFLRRYANGAALRGWDYQSERRVDLVIGAAMAIRRELLDRIGLFDERFFLYHEEVDLAHRARDAGYETWFVPSSEATHEGRGSSAGRDALVERRKRSSRRRYWIKHHGRLWYLSLGTAVAGRYVLYLGLLGAVVSGGRRFLGR